MSEDSASPVLSTWGARLPTLIGVGSKLDRVVHDREGERTNNADKSAGNDQLCCQNPQIGNGNSELAEANRRTV